MADDKKKKSQDRSCPWIVSPGLTWGPWDQKGGEKKKTGVCTQADVIIIMTLSTISSTCMQDGGRKIDSR
jgi:hypothetical protein